MPIGFITDSVPCTQYRAHPHRIRWNRAHPVTSCVSVRADPFARARAPPLQLPRRPSLPPPPPSSSQPPFVNRPSWASSMPPVRDKTKTVGRWQGPTHPRRGGAGGWSGGLGRSSKQRLAAGLAPPLPPSTMSCTTPSSVSCIGASPLLPPSMTCRTVVPLFSLC
jgi:hypothetical protein